MKTSTQSVIVLAALTSLAIGIVICLSSLVRQHDRKVQQAIFDHRYDSADAFKAYSLQLRAKAMLREDKE